MTLWSAITSPTLTWCTPFGPAKKTLAPTLSFQLPITWNGGGGGSCGGRAGGGASGPTKGATVITLVGTGDAPGMACGACITAKALRGSNSSISRVPADKSPPRLTLLVMMTDEVAATSAPATGRATAGVTSTGAWTDGGDNHRRPASPIISRSRICSRLDFTADRPRRDRSR